MGKVDKWGWCSCKLLKVNCTLQDKRLKKAELDATNLLKQKRIIVILFLFIVLHCFLFINLSHVLFFVK
jgi:hypothetical protein